MLARLNYDGVPGAEMLALPDGGWDSKKIVLNVVPALHLGAVLDSLWEDYVEVDGAILRRRFVDQGGVEEWEHLGTVREIEAIANFRDLWYVPKYDEKGVPDAFLEAVAEIVGEMWLANVRTQFPGRKFVVVVTKAERDDGPTVILTQDDSDGPVPFRPGVGENR
jgi:hypothetical protein